MLATGFFPPPIGAAGARQEKEPLHLQGDPGRFHGLLSQRVIEVS